MGLAISRCVAGRNGRGSKQELRKDRISKADKSYRVSAYSTSSKARFSPLSLPGSRPLPSSLPARFANQMPEGRGKMRMKFVGGKGAKQAGGLSYICTRFVFQCRHGLKFLLFRMEGQKHISKAPGNVPLETRGVIVRRHMHTA